MIKKFIIFIIAISIITTPAYAISYNQLAPPSESDSLLISIPPRERYTPLRRPSPRHRSPVTSTIALMSLVAFTARCNLDLIPITRTGTEQILEASLIVGIDIDATILSYGDAHVEIETGSLGQTRVILSREKLNTIYFASLNYHIDPPVYLNEGKMIIRAKANRNGAKFRLSMGISLGSIIIVLEEEYNEIIIDFKKRKVTILRANGTIEDLDTSGFNWEQITQLSSFSGFTIEFGNKSSENPLYNLSGNTVNDIFELDEVGFIDAGTTDFKTPGDSVDLLKKEASAWINRSH